MVSGTTDRPGDRSECVEDALLSRLINIEMFTRGADWISHRSSVHPKAALEIPEMRTWLRSRPITSRIPRRGVETSTKLSRHRWLFGGSLARLAGYRHPTLRYERCARLFTAFFTRAGTLTCHQKRTTWDKL
jgi:hypothetical protein